MIKEEMSSVLTRAINWTNYYYCSSSSNHPHQLIKRFSATTLKLFCSKEDKGKDCPPEAPSASMCCMSGCANCVWLEHADEVVKYYSNKKGKLDVDALLKQVEEQIEDEMMKAFIKTELKFKFKHLQQ